MFFLEAKEPITLEQWTAAVAAVDGVRIDSEPCEATNPKTGEVISLQSCPGDAAVFFPERGTWHKVFLLSKSGLVRFSAPSGWVDDHSSPLRAVALALASTLQAKVVDEEGEAYG